MKRIPILFLAGLFLFSACEQKRKAPRTQVNFLMRLKRAQDTAKVFTHQEAIRTRIVTNMSKYLRDSALSFTDWTFKVTGTSPSQVNLQSTDIGDTTASNVKFAMLLSQADAKIKEKVASLKTDEVIKVSGEMNMKTPDGKISMTSYFNPDSAQVIKFIPKAIK